MLKETLMQCEVFRIFHSIDDLKNIVPWEGRHFY